MSISKMRGQLSYSIEDLWARRLAPAVKEKLERSNKIIEETKDGELETRSVS